MEALSAAESAALWILERDGMESYLAAAYIGRARSRLAGLDPSSQTIADCVIGLVNAEQLDPSAAAALEAAHHQENLALVQILRETVELERAKLPPKPDLASGAPVRLTLYAERLPKAGSDPAYNGSFKLGTRTFSVRAWVGRNGNFVNLELSNSTQ